MKKNNNVCVVGGGPAGALVAYGLANQGHKVTLFESYCYQRSKMYHQGGLGVTSGGKKAYCIVLNPRGQRALRDTGLDWSKWTTGTCTTELVRHFPNKASQSFPTQSLVISRMALVNTLLDEATRVGVEIRYNHKLVDIDMGAQMALFSVDENQTLVQFQFDLLVGCDGVKSQVRSVLEEKVPSFHCRKEEDTMQYQVAIIPKTMDDMLLATTRQPKNDNSNNNINNNNINNNINHTKPSSVHSWNDRARNSLCLSFPYENRGTLFLLVFPGDTFCEMQQNDTYHEKVASLLPDIHETDLHEIVRQLKQGKPSSGGTCIWPSRFGVDNIVLVGDSAHGMWPSLGQGCNCALESAAVFLSMAKRWLGEYYYCNDPSTLVAQYSQERYRDAMAAVNLTYHGFGGGKSRHRHNAPILFMAQMTLMMLLHKVSLGLVPQPAMLRLMKGHAEGYRSLEKHVSIYEKIVLFSSTILVPTASFMIWSWLMKQKRKP